MVAVGDELPLPLPIAFAYGLPSAWKTQRRADFLQASPDGVHFSDSRPDARPRRQSLTPAHPHARVGTIHKKPLPGFVKTKENLTAMRGLQRSASAQSTQVNPRRQYR